MSGSSVEGMETHVDHDRGARVDPDQLNASLKRGQSEVVAPGPARFTSEMGRYLPVNILDSGRSGQLVRVCAQFQSIGLGNRFELVYLDEPGVTIY